MTHIEQEKRTVRQMVEIYCYGKKHTAKGLCEECSALLDYAYQRLDHWPADSMEVCGEIDKSLNAVICKNLFLSNRQETEFYLLLIPGNKPFKTKYLSAQLGVSRLSFGKETYMEEFLDNTPGSATVLGLMNDTRNRVRLVIDRDVLTHEYLGCHPCINTSSLKLRTKDVFETFLKAVHHDYRIVHL